VNVRYEGIPTPPGCPPSFSPTFRKSPALRILRLLVARTESTWVSLMVRSILCLFAAAFVLLLGACCPEDPFSPTPINQDTTKFPAFLRIVHAAADAPPAAPVLGGTQFKGSLPYLTYRTGVNEAKYYPADTSLKTIAFIGDAGTLASGAIDMKVGEYYTAFLYGKAPTYHVLVTRDSVLPNPGLDKVKMRVVNLAPDAPPIDLVVTTAPTDPVVRNVGYGQASSYVLRPGDQFSPPGPGLNVVESATGRTVFSYPEGRIFLPTGISITMVVSGEITPTGDGALLGFAAFFDGTQDPDDRLYGAIPFKLDLVAIRLIDLIQAPATDSVDLAIQDLVNGKPNENNYFRRNIPGQDSIKGIRSLANATEKPEGYFLYSASNPAVVYRVEKSTRETWSPLDQTPLSRVDTLRTIPNRRYTVIAYGENAPQQVRTVELQDNMPDPSSPSLTRLRFFHGGFGALASQTLRLRIGGASSPLQQYGQAPDGASMSFDAPSGGAVTLELVDGAGTVVHSSQHALEGGKAYTVFLAPVPDGTGYILRPVLDEITR
jgi:hypothetical protein